MKTVQMTLDNELVAAVDKVAKQLHTSRSAFTRDALRLALEQLEVKRLEKLHREGYHKQPSTEDDSSIWESEQDWDDA